MLRVFSCSKLLSVVLVPRLMNHRPDCMTSQPDKSSTRSSGNVLNLSTLPSRDEALRRIDEVLYVDLSSLSSETVFLPPDVAAIEFQVTACRSHFKEGQRGWGRKTSI